MKKTGEELTSTILNEFDLVKTFQGVVLPVNALILLSDDELKKKIFPYAKIEVDGVVLHFVCPDGFIFLPVMTPADDHVCLVRKNEPAVFENVPFPERDFVFYDIEFSGRMRFSCD